MRKWLMIFCAMAVTALFCSGCSWTTQETSKDTKDTMTRCPKCAAFFSSKEGAEIFRGTQPGSK
jgi:hypothetical protein